MCQEAFNNGLLLLAVKTFFFLFFLVIDSQFLYFLQQFAFQQVILMHEMFSLIIHVFNPVSFILLCKCEYLFYLFLFLLLLCVCVDFTEPKGL